MAWVAGVIEGEGTFYLLTSGLYMYVKVEMCDEDVVNEIHRITGIGRVSGPKHDGNPKHKPTYRWVVSASRDVQHLLLQLYPYLSDRRRATINELRLKLNTNRGTRWPRLLQREDPDEPPYVLREAQ
jgi:hypothetical protein